MVEEVVVYLVTAGDDGDNRLLSSYTLLKHLQQGDARGLGLGLGLGTCLR